jgi:predicted N-acetyltransferase YhbS
VTSPVGVRLATPEDDYAIGELLVRSFTATYARKMPEVVLTDARLAELRAVAKKRTQATVLAAELSGKVVGTVALFAPGAESSEAFKPNAADLRHLAVEPGLHGRGISNALLDEAEKMARGWGVSAICLHVRRGATGVAGLYQRRGYQRDASGDLDTPSVFLQAYWLPL